MYRISEFLIRPKIRLPKTLTVLLDEREKQKGFTSHVKQRGCHFTLSRPFSSHTLSVVSWTFRTGPSPPKRGKTLTQPYLLLSL